MHVAVEILCAASEQDAPSIAMHQRAERGAHFGCLRADVIVFRDDCGRRSPSVRRPFCSSSCPGRLAAPTQTLHEFPHCVAPQFAQSCADYADLRLDFRQVPSRPGPPKFPTTNRFLHQTGAFYVGRKGRAGQRRVFRVSSGRLSTVRDQPSESQSLPILPISQMLDNRHDGS